MAAFQLNSVHHFVVSNQHAEIVMHVYAPLSLNYILAVSNET